MLRLLFVLLLLSSTCFAGTIKGIASWYDYTLKCGWSSIGHFVCATRDFKRKSIVRITNLDTGKSVKCLVTDYGPDGKLHPDRIVDLSSTAFSRIGNIKHGLLNVKVEKIR